jgi:alpha-amylase
MFLMVDVVANHVVTPIAEEFTASSTYGMFDQPEDYHPFRWLDDYNDQWLVENGWIPGIDGIALVDLNTESEKVVRCMYDWVGWLVREYGIDGLRVDSVKHGEDFPPT